LVQLGAGLGPISHHTSVVAFLLIFPSGDWVMIAS
jgi:hypothetical protein